MRPGDWRHGATDTVIDPLPETIPSQACPRDTWSGHLHLSHPNLPQHCTRGIWAFRLKMKYNLNDGQKGHKIVSLMSLSVPANSQCAPVVTAPVTGEGSTSSADGTVTAVPGQDQSWITLGPADTALPRHEGGHTIWALGLHNFS